MYTARNIALHTIIFHGFTPCPRTFNTFLKMLIFLNPLSFHFLYTWCQIESEKRKELNLNFTFATSYRINFEDVAYIKPELPATEWVSCKISNSCKVIEKLDSLINAQAINLNTFCSVEINFSEKCYSDWLKVLRPLLTRTRKRIPLQSVEK